MKNSNRNFRLSLLSAALIAAFGPALAEDEEDVKPLITPDSQVSVGAGYWTNDRPMMGQYDGMRDQGLYGLFDADVAKRIDETGTWILFSGRNLGLDNRDLRLEVTRQGQWGGYGEYSRTPYDSPYTISTRLSGIGTANVSYQNATGTPCPSAGCQTVELGTLRETIRVGGFLNLMQGLDFKVDFRSDTKTGTRQWGWGSAPLFSVLPLDNTTRQLEAILQYSNEKLQLSGGYFGSWFSTDITQVNERVLGANGQPIGGTTGFSGVTPMSQPMSNYAHQIYADGGYNFTPTTRATFKASYTKAYQDETLPSASYTGVNAPITSAYANLDGQVDTTLLQASFTSRPLPKLSVFASARYYDVDDKTPIGQTVNNATGAATTRVFTTPQSYTTTAGKLEATYRLPLAFSVTGGVDYSKQDRSAPKAFPTSDPTVGNSYVPYRTNLDELTWRLQVRRSFAESLSGYLTYLHSTRDGNAYTLINSPLSREVSQGGAATASTPAEQLIGNRINPIHIADRKRDTVRLAFDWEPIDKLGLQFRTDQSRDDYPSNGRPYGSQEGRSEVYAVDANYAIGDNWQFAAYYAYNKSSITDKGYRGNVNQGVTAPQTGTRTADLEDKGNSAGVSLRGKVTSKATVEAAADWFDSTSSYAQTLAAEPGGQGTQLYPSGGGVAAFGPLPDVNNNILRLRLSGTYAVAKSSDVRLDYIHERFKTDDWTWQYANGSTFNYITGAASGTTNVNDGTTVSMKQNQSANYFGVRYIYKFQ